MSTAQELRALGVRVHAQTADVTRTGDIVPLVESTEKELGPITILVNNAGIGGFGPVHEKSEEEWDRVLNTNLKSVFLVSRAVVPAMIRRGGGDISKVTLTSLPDNACHFSLQGIFKAVMVIADNVFNTAQTSGLQTLKKRSPMRFCFTQTDAYAQDFTHPFGTYTYCR